MEKFSLLIFLTLNVFALTKLPKDAIKVERSSLVSKIDLETMAIMDSFGAGECDLIVEKDDEFIIQLKTKNKSQSYATEMSFNFDDEVYKSSKDLKFQNGKPKGKEVTYYNVEDERIKSLLRLEYKSNGSLKLISVMDHEKSAPNNFKSCWKY